MLLVAIAFSCLCVCVCVRVAVYVFSVILSHYLYIKYIFKYRNLLANQIIALISFKNFSHFQGRRRTNEPSRGIAILNHFCFVVVVAFIRTSIEFLQF